MRSASYQLHAAKFPVRRDLAGFDFEVSPVDCALVTKLASAESVEHAHNVVFVGGLGTGKTQLAWLGEHRRDIEAFLLPSYSPELNPDEPPRLTH